MMSDLSRSASIAPADPGVLRVIRQSADRLTQLEDVFIQQLHHEVTILIPDLASRLAADGRAFCARTVQSMLWAAVTDQPPQVVADSLRQVGAINRLEGFSPEAQYQNVAHALLRAVRELIDDDWSTTLGSAWISYFQWVEAYLMEGAQQAAQQAAVRAQPTAETARDGHPQVEAGDVDLESVTGLLDDEDEEDAGFGQIMVSMTRSSRREPPRQPD